jgi:hypothetical protein
MAAARGRRGDVYGSPYGDFQQVPHGTWMSYQSTGVVASRRSPSHDVQPTGGPSAGSPSPGSAVSRAGADVLILLLRAGIPSAEILAARTDREYGLLAQRYNISLPLHLQHLPLLPAPRQAAAPEPEVPAELEGEALKDRPPREIRHRLRDVALDHTTKSPKDNRQQASAPAPASETTLSPIEKAKQKFKAHNLSPPHEGEDEVAVDDPIRGTVSKERAPSSRRPRQENPLETKPTKERPPRKSRQGKKSAGT